MSNELTKTKLDTDGFEGFESRREGDDRPQGDGVIQGTLARFTNEAQWLTRDEEELPPDLEVIAINILRVVQKWIDQQPVETRVLEPGELFPDLGESNDACPKSEWHEGPDGKMRGPWQAQYIVHLLNPATMEKYSFATGTVGGGIAVRDLRDKVVWMRRLRGQSVYPVVTLADKHMKTRFGGRQRPHFNIVCWVGLGGGGDEKALPAPVRVVQEPTLAEEMGDSLPEHSAKPAVDEGKPWSDELPDDLKKPAAQSKPAAQKPRTTKKKIAGSRGR